MVARIELGRVGACRAFAPIDAADIVVRGMAPATRMHVIDGAGPVACGVSDDVWSPP